MFRRFDIPTVQFEMVGLGAVRLGWLITWPVGLGEGGVNWRVAGHLWGKQVMYQAQ